MSCILPKLQLDYMTCSNSVDGSPSMTSQPVKQWLLRTQVQPGCSMAKANCLAENRAETSEQSRDLAETSDASSLAGKATNKHKSFDISNAWNMPAHLFCSKMLKPEIWQPGHFQHAKQHWG